MECRAVVAISASYCRMTVTKRKARLGMIELPQLPSRFGMTVIAGRPQLCLVNVVAQMARHTSRWCLPVFLATPMTRAAFCFCMQSEENVVRKGMIKRRDLQPNDIRPAPLVLSVAIAAHHLGFQPPVISLALRYVTCHLLVAVQTQPGLLVFPERNMALATVGLDIRVPFDHFSGHDERLELSGGDRS